MQKLRRWAAAALCGAAFAGSAAAVLAACAVCPGRAWIVRGALFLQDPAAAAAIAWPADRSEEHTSELQSLFTISYAVSWIGRAHV